MASRPPKDLPSATDRLFSRAEGAPSEFRFDEAVARVFPDMLRRSIPGYSALLHLIGVLASRVVKDGTTIYDLGCSLGAVSLSIRHAVGARDAKIFAVDSSEAMTDRCREISSADSGLCPVEVQCADMLDIDYEPASLIVLNFTLQFAPPAQRQEFLRRLAACLVPGGALVLSEKTATGTGADALLAELHDAFRESNGYSRLELSRKREALERVLIPERADRYLDMLEAAGLTPLEWFRCLHFVSWVAVKEGE